MHTLKALTWEFLLRAAALTTIAELLTLIIAAGLIRLVGSLRHANKLIGTNGCRRRLQR